METVFEKFYVREKKEIDYTTGHKREYSEWVRSERTFCLICWDNMRKWKKNEKIGDIRLHSECIQVKYGHVLSSSWAQPTKTQ